MNSNDIQILANDHCWKEDAERQVKKCFNHLMNLGKLPEDNEAFRYESKDVQTKFAADRLKSAVERQRELNKKLIYSHATRRHCQCISDFRRLSPEKGYLRLMRVILHLTAVNGARPFKADCQGYIRVKYGCTYNMDQTFAALHKMGLCDFRKGWEVTLLGKALLKAKGCLDKAA